MSAYGISYSGARPVLGIIRTDGLITVVRRVNGGGRKRSLTLSNSLDTDRGQQRFSWL